MIKDTDILTAREVAEALRIDHNTIYRLVRENKIPYKKVSTQIRFLGWQINDWLNTKREQAKEARIRA